MNRGGESEQRARGPYVVARLSGERRGPTTYVAFVAEDPTPHRLIRSAVETDVAPDVVFLFFDRGTAALEAFGTCRPHAILIDHRLPDADGLELLRAMKSSPALADVPVAVLLDQKWSWTALSSALDAGAEAYISRPFNEPVLLRAVRELLRRAQIDGPRADRAPAVAFVGSETPPRGMPKPYINPLDLYMNERRTP